MKLWLLSQEIKTGYDVYDSCIVAAEDDHAAVQFNPDLSGWKKDNTYGAWADFPSQVSIEYLGEAREGMPPGIILASFNAG